MTDITPHQLLNAYTNGYFPMAMRQDDPELYWFSPDERGVLPLDGFHIPRGLKRAMKTHDYTITVDRAFEQVIRSCGARTPDRQETWINETIVALYTELHGMGCAHSVEVWGREDDSEAGSVAPSPLRGGSGRGAAYSSRTNPRPPTDAPKSASTPPQGGSVPASPPSFDSTHRLVGGLYGVSIGGAFFGESMFSRAPDASKIALVTLVEILREAGYSLLDTQYVNAHLKQFGVVAIAKEDYITKLENALSASPNPSSFFSTVSVRKGLASSSSDSAT